jgi:hypothetical protein
LRAELNGKRDQAVFDLTLTRATLRFHPPTASEIFASESSAGFVRALGPVQILFLGALALAARTRRELAALAGMFVLGQILAVLMVPRTGWQPAPRFVEAATALTVAYLAVEILLLPRAGSRWIVAGILGAFHGLYFHLFLQNTGYSPAYVLLGAAAAELMALIAFAFLLSRVTRYARIPATALLVFSMVWFVMRLRG